MWVVDLELIEPRLDEQDEATVARILGALELLKRNGPMQGRPLVDTLKHTKVKNLKELRPASPGTTEVRILFAFDPKRKAIMLVAGDKARGKNGKAKWSGWYREAIPKAEMLFEEYLIRQGGSGARH